MSSVTIPNWTADGLLPPVDEVDPTSAERSPYRASLTDVVLRFATSPQRVQILSGLLRYRAALHATGLSDGFQWLDGSFLENIELMESRPPEDIDIVTFYKLPSGETQRGFVARHRELFDRRHVKSTFYVDPFFTHLGRAPEAIVAAEAIVERSAYWYGVWSHRRDWRWKGFVQVQLSGVDDADAQELLATRTSQGATP